MKNILVAIFSALGALAAYPAAAVVSLHSGGMSFGVLDFGAIGATLGALGIGAIAVALAYRFLKAR